MIYSVTRQFVSIHAAIPTRDPPILEISALNASEDSPVTFYLSAYSSTSGVDTSSGITIKIIDFPAQSRFSRGTFNGQFWILTSNDFGYVELFLPEHLSGTFMITAEALYTNTSVGRIGTIQFTVQPVPDAPSLNVTLSPCIDSRNLVFMISSSLVDSDGSESLVVAVSGLPIGSQLSVGQVNAEGDYILDPEELQRSITATLPMTFLNTINIGFTATATESLSNRTSSTITNASISICPEGTYNLYTRIILIACIYIINKCRIQWLSISRRQHLEYQMAKYCTWCYCYSGVPRRTSCFRYEKFAII